MCRQESITIIGIGSVGEFVLESLRPLGLAAKQALRTMLVRAQERPSGLCEDDFIDDVLCLRPLISEPTIDELQKEREKVVWSSASECIGIHGRHIEYDEVLLGPQDDLRRSITQLVQSGKIRTLENAIDTAMTARVAENSKHRFCIIGASCDNLCRAITMPILNYINAYVNDRYGAGGKGMPRVEMYLFDPEVFFDHYTGQSVRSILRSNSRRMLEELNEQPNQIALRRVSFTNSQGQRLRTAEDYCRSLAFGLIAQLCMSGLDDAWNPLDCEAFGASALVYPRKALALYTRLQMVLSQITWWNDANKLWDAGGWEEYGFTPMDSDRFYLNWINSQSSKGLLASYVGYEADSVRRFSTDCLQDVLHKADSWVNKGGLKECLGSGASLCAQEAESLRIPAVVEAVLALHPVAARALVYECSLGARGMLETIRQKRQAQGVGEQGVGKDTKNELAHLCAQEAFVESYENTLRRCARMFEDLFCYAIELEDTLQLEMRQVELACRHHTGEVLHKIGVSQKELNSFATKYADEVCDTYAQEINWSGLYVGIQDPAIVGHGNPVTLLRTTLIQPLLDSHSRCAMELSRRTNMDAVEVLRHLDRTQQVLADALCLASPTNGVVAESQLERRLLVSSRQSQELAPESMFERVLECSTLPDTWLLVYRDACGCTTTGV